MSTCPIEKKCGGCCYLNKTYEEQKLIKEKYVRKLMNGIAKVDPVIGMEEPWHYRNKVNAAFARRKNGEIISGIYEEGTHRVVPVRECLIEDRQADLIIGDIRKLAADFHLMIYDEDRRTGFLRHVMVRRGHRTGQYLVILVAASPVFPSRKNFVRSLLAKHPEVESVVLNVNDRKTTMVLGKRNITLYGSGTIDDVLCGKTFRISPGSFYQINSVQTEKLYHKAIELAGLTGKETVFDSYCGIGTIGIVAADHAGRVIGVELNKQAVADANFNAKRNQCDRIEFHADDAGRFLVRMAERREKADVIFMDPPRSGSTPEFIDAAVRIAPEKIVYISCDPETLARDLKLFRKKGYQAGTVYPVDMFPWTRSIECVVALSKCVPTKKAAIRSTK